MASNLVLVASWSALARPRRLHRLDGEHTKVLVHPLWPCLDVLDDDGYRLIVRPPCGTHTLAAAYPTPAINPAQSPCFTAFTGRARIKETLTSWQEVICAVQVFRTRWHRQRKQQDRNSELRHRPPQRISDTSLPSHTAPTAKQNIRINTTTSEPGVQ